MAEKPMIASCSIITVEGQAEGGGDYRNSICAVMPQRRINVDCAQDLWLLLKTLIDGGFVKLIINMSDVALIDSAGIGTLINAAKIIRQNKGNIAIIGVSPDIMGILDMVSFRKFISVFETEDDTMQFFQDK